MTDNERWVATLNGLQAIVDDPARSRADRIKARNAVRAMLDTQGGSTLGAYQGGGHDTRGRAQATEAEYDGWNR